MKTKHINEVKVMAQILYKLAWGSDSIDNVVSDPIKIDDQFSFFVRQNGVMLQISVNLAGDDV